MAKQQPLKIIKIVYEGVRQSTYSKAMASHKDRDSTYLKNSEPLFWYSNYKEVAESYIKSCENCPKQVDLKLKTNSKLHSIPVPSNVETTGSRILCIDFYREWLDAKPIRTSNHMFGRVIWDKLPERFFENFQKS